MKIDLQNWRPFVCDLSIELEIEAIQDGFLQYKSVCSVRAWFNSFNLKATVTFNSVPNQQTPNNRSIASSRNRVTFPVLPTLCIRNYSTRIVTQLPAACLASDLHVQCRLSEFHLCKWPPTPWLPAPRRDHKLHRTGLVYACSPIPGCWSVGRAVMWNACHLKLCGDNFISAVWQHWHRYYSAEAQQWSLLISHHPARHLFLETTCHGQSDPIPLSAVSSESFGRVKSAECHLNLHASDSCVTKEQNW